MPIHYNGGICIDIDRHVSELHSGSLFFVYTTFNHVVLFFVVGQVRSHHPPINTDMMYQRRSPINAPQPGAPASSCKDGQAKFIFQLLSKDSTPVKSLSVQKFFATLSKNMTAKWEGLARMLDLGENDIYTINSDYKGSVQEQAVKMFHKWLENNGSSATLGVLATAVYESGSEYWNLLDIVNKYAPKH